METLMLTLIGSAIGGIAWLTYQHTKKMLKVHYICIALSMCVVLFLIYIQNTINESYSNATLEISLINIKLGKGNDDLLLLAESSVISKQVADLAANQQRLYISAYIVILFAIFIGLSFLFLYLRDEKKVENKNQPPNPPITEE